MGNPKFNINWDVEQMRIEAEAVARSEGISDRNEIKAFRHAYVSAKLQEYLRNKAKNLGTPNSVSNKIAKDSTHIIGNRYESITAILRGNPRDAWAQDIDNNAVGRARENQLNKQGLPEKEKEKRLREEIGLATRNGDLQIYPTSSNQRYDYTQEPIETVLSNIRTKLQNDISPRLSKPKSTLGRVMEEQFKKYRGKF